LYFQIADSSALAMNKWIYLTLAIFSEVMATASLKSTEGFTKLWPSVLVLVGYSAAFYFLSLTLDTIPIGVAYAIWSGVGVAAITLVSIFFFDQKIDTAGFIGIGLIVAGVIILRLFSESAVEV
jgi:small multidrug resistance pump